MIQKSLNINFFNTDLSFDSPSIASQLAYGLECIVDTLRDVAINGTHRLTGTNTEYIAGIFNGTQTEPFVDPLNCVDASLFYMIDKINYNLGKVVNELKKLYKPTKCK